MTVLEPAYATALDWLLCDALGRIAAGPAETATAAPAEDGAYYFRLTTRPLDQAPFEAARARLGDAVLRRQVLAGAYRLVDAQPGDPAGRARRSCTWPPPARCCPRCSPRPRELADEGIAAHVVDVTSPGPALPGLAADPAAGRADRDHAGRRRRAAGGVRRPGAGRDRARRRLARDGLARLGARRARACRSASTSSASPARVAELYELHDLLPGCIVNAALAALDLYSSDV